MTRGLLPEDRSEIKVVEAAARDVWFRHARPEYFCPDCGRTHRSYSGIGQRHASKRVEALREARAALEASRGSA